MFKELFQSALVWLGRDLSIYSSVLLNHSTCPFPAGWYRVVWECWMSQSSFICANNLFSNSFPSSWWSLVGNPCLRTKSPKIFSYFFRHMLGHSAWSGPLIRGCIHSHPCSPLDQFEKVSGSYVYQWRSRHLVWTFSFRTATHLGNIMFHISPHMTPIKPLSDEAQGALHSLVSHFLIELLKHQLEGFFWAALSGFVLLLVNIEFLPHPDITCFSACTEQSPHLYGLISATLATDLLPHTCTLFRALDLFLMPLSVPQMLPSSFVVRLAHDLLQNKL